MTPNDGFPFKTSLSFHRLMDCWADLGREPDSPWAEHARRILERAARAPELRGRITDPEVVRRHQPLIADLLTAVFPPAAAGVVGAVASPFELRLVYQTPDAERLRVFDAETIARRSSLDAQLLQFGKAVSAYHEILRRFYGIDQKLNYPVIVTVDEPGTGLLLHLTLQWDSRFVSIDCEVEPRSLSSTDRARIANEPTNLDLLQRLIPPDDFEFRGVTVLRAHDVTEQEVVSRIKEDLLDSAAMSSPVRVDRIEQRMRNLMRNPKLRVGLIGFETETGIEAVDRARVLGRSLLLHDHLVPACPQRNQSYYAEVIHSREPVIVPDLETCERCTGFEHHLMAHDIRSLVLHPLFAEDRLVGLLELGSPRAGDLNALATLRLRDVVPTFATAVERTLDEAENEIQAVIKRRYTSIHPSVEWRFRDAARRIISASEDEAPAQPEQIVFRDVYPLYGLTDIRGSSQLRNEAIRADVIRQLELGLDVLEAAREARGMPVIDELVYKARTFRERIEGTLFSEEETSVLEFLATDIEPVLDRLASLGSDVAAAVERYRQALEPELGVVYEQRKAFDESVMLLNEAVSDLIDRAEAESQALVPHFFEKFKTDGVDFNLYVGASLLQSGSFDRLDLRNLRIWQLILSCRIEWEARSLLSRLPTPLEVAHLILVQDQPLSIRFRIDEKRFDVDGAYNVRYELVKKRIDKAVVRGTGERLTQPRQLAIVYAQPGEAREYQRYLEFLIARGLLTGPVESLELEDMQGVYGLRALRVGIAPEPTQDAPETAAEVARQLEPITP